MLKYLKFKNFRSYYEETILSMEVRDAREKKNCFSLHPSIASESLYKTMMVTGFNAAGKSNLLRVLNYIEFLVTYQASSKSTRNVFTIADESFRFIDGALNEPREFEVGVIEDDVYFEYSFKISKTEVLEECLKCREKSDKSERLQKIRTLFRRDKTGLIESVDGFDKLAFFGVSNDTLFISKCAARGFNVENCPLGCKFVNWFNRYDYAVAPDFSILKNRDSSAYNNILNFIRKTDKSLKRIEVKETKLEIPVELEDNHQEVMKALRENKLSFGAFLVKMEDGLYAIDLDFVYDKYSSNNGKAVDEITESVFSGKLASMGQRRLISLLIRVAVALEEGWVLIEDELDDSLHHSFPKFILDLFNSEKHNPNNAQLIFSSHKANLLDTNHSGLSKSQMLLVKKDKYGISRLSHFQKYGKPVKSDLVLSRYYLSDNFDSDTTLPLEEYLIPNIKNDK